MSEVVLVCLTFLSLVVLNSGQQQQPVSYNAFKNHKRRKIVSNERNLVMERIFRDERLFVNGTTTFKKTKGSLLDIIQLLCFDKISCHLCRGPKFICERSHVSSACLDPSQQFCINDVENLKDGSRYVTRRCATKAECDKDWITESSYRNECSHYNVVILQDAHFECSFCCQGDNCNLQTVPDNLYGSVVG